MRVTNNAFETLALRRVERSPSNLIHLYTGISFRGKRPFREEAHVFTLSAQWIARALFSETLANDVLRDISHGLGVIYTPRSAPAADLQEFANHFLGRVRGSVSADKALVSCRDNAMRPIPLADLTLEASPEAIRRYDLRTGSQQGSFRTWRRIQQLSKVLTGQGRRNLLVLRDRLEGIRGMLGGQAKEQLILPLDGFATGTVSIGLDPLRAEFMS
jgi:hypothetical protein